MNELVDIGWYEMFLLKMFPMQEISNVLDEIKKRLNLSFKYLALEEELSRKGQTVDFNT